MKRITRVIRALSHKQTEIGQLKALVRKIGETERWGYPDGWRLSVFGGTLHVYLDDFDKLSEARAFLRERLDGWTDKQVEMFTNAGGGVTVKWRSPEYGALIEIMFAVNKPEDFPAALLPSEKCRVEVAQSKPIEEMRVVCPIAE